MSNCDSENLDILLNTAQIKHESVLSNIRSVDIKISILLALFGVLFLPSIEILTWRMINCELAFIKYLPILILGIGIILCLLAIYPRKEFTIPKLLTLRKMFIEGMKSDQFKGELFAYYDKAIEENGKLAIRKLLLFRIVYYLLAGSFLLIMFIFIFQGGIHG